MLGDRRSGRQLLADAPADAAETFASLDRTPAGRARLDSVAAHLEMLLADLDPAHSGGSGHSWGAPL